MKRTMALILTVVMMLGLTQSIALARGMTIGIVMQKENGAFLDMKAGILQKLAENGYTEDTADIEYRCAQGDATALATICNSFDGFDLVFTIATPATQQFVNMESDTPCFFCAVSAPVAAGVITDMNAPDKNATGTSNAIPVENIFALADVLTPGISCYGLIYSTAETNAVNTVEACKKYLAARGIDYVAKAVNTSAEVAMATEALIMDGCEAIFVPNDSNVQAGVSALVELCMEYEIPTYCASATTVESGCLATIAIDDKGIGEKTADMALAYLNGTAIEDIPSIVVDADYVSVNVEMLAALSLDMTETTLAVGETVYDVHYLGK